MQTIADIIAQLGELRERVAQLEARANRSARVTGQSRGSFDRVLEDLARADLLRRLEIPQHHNDND